MTPADGEQVQRVAPRPERGGGAGARWLAAVYLILAAYLPISRVLPPGHSTRTFLDGWVPLVPWLGPVYVLGMVPFALLPFLLWRWLPPATFRRYALATITGALATYAVYFLYPTEIHRPPLPADPLERWCLGLAYAARRPTGILPSGHAFYTATNAWFLCALLRPIPRLLWIAVSALIVSAALLTHLHHVADILAGLALFVAVVAGVEAAGKRSGGVGE